MTSFIGIEENIKKYGKCDFAIHNNDNIDELLLINFINVNNFKIDRVEQQGDYRIYFIKEKNILELLKLQEDIVNIKMDLLFIGSDFIQPENITKDRAEANRLKIQKVCDKLELIRLKLEDLK